MNNVPYFYDLEVAPNLFTATFIKNQAISIIRAYEKVSIKLKNKNLTLDDLAKYSQLKKELLKILNPIIFVIRLDKLDDLEILYDFVSRHKIIVGFNSNHYDKNILDYIYYMFNKLKNGYDRKTNQHIVSLIYNLSADCIDFGEGFYNVFRTNYVDKFYKSPFTDWDIQKILRLDKIFVSLKQIAIILKWYRVQDLPYGPHEMLPLANVKNYRDDPLIVKILDYNMNDVLITMLLFHTKIDEIHLRENVSKIYHVPVYNESRSSMANKLFAKFYTDATGITKRELGQLRTIRHKVKFIDIIDDKISFQTDYFKKLLSELKSYEYNIGDKFSRTVIFNNKKYKLAKGGLHSDDEPNVYLSNDKFLYIDADVTSFYPRIIINGKFVPAHLVVEAFIAILEMILNKRVSSKAITKKIKKLLHIETSEDIINQLKNALPKYETEMEALKIVVNAIFGKMGEENSPLYDLKAMYSTTINGQLYLFELIESLAIKGFQNISANTDGVITKVPVEKYNEFVEICKAWEKKFSFSLEYTKYSKYVCYSVNNYIAIKDFKDREITEDDIKKKGLFLTDLSVEKGYFAPVISKALFEYYANDIPIEQTLHTNTDIYDFCISQKSKESFNNVLLSINPDDQGYLEELLQKNVRFYISNITNSNIVKRYKNPKPNKKGVVVKQVSIISKRNLQIFNDYYEVDKFDDYGVNYNFYYNECMKVISAIDFNRNTLFSQ